MGKTTRFGVSLNSDLLSSFDAYCSKRGYGNRSEALRDLIRDALVQEEWEGEDGNMAATLTMVYDHHKSDLAQKMAELQHDAHHLIITTLHVHLDHHNCLEVLVLKGSGEEIRIFSEKLLSTKGVLYGRFSSATTGKNLC